MVMEIDLVRLENNGKCLFCKSPPAASKQLKLYPVRTLLQYLRMGKVSVRINPEAEVEQLQPTQVIEVDLQEPMVKAALCEGCGDLVEMFLELNLGMQRRLRSYLTSIQTRIMVGNENVGLEYPSREGTIMREALERLQRTQPGIISMVTSPSQVIRVEPLEVVQLQKNEEGVQENIQKDPSSTPISSEDNKMECSSSIQPRKEKRGMVNNVPVYSTQTDDAAMISNTLTMRENVSLSHGSSPSRKRKCSESNRNAKDQSHVPASAYSFFVYTCREEHKKQYPNETILFKEFFAKCAYRWKIMNDNKKARFQKMADQYKMRCNHEMKLYIPPKSNKGGGKKRKKDPNAPKRSMSAFFWFCNDERANVKRAYPDYGVVGVAKELGKMWEAVDPATRWKYEDMAGKDKYRYDRDMAAYKNSHCYWRQHNDDGDRQIAMAVTMMKMKATREKKKVRKMVKK